ncbi:SNF2 domain-containing protein CLASSY 2-like [Oryza brachyantha]|uniref:SNF2 domain-containing protein CLASSY 2-like n=1 Tax=Oryza brachyantha TaxID=4533 RepID=UPI001ADB0CBE|nr:SNF2 domain-containing protein CLASSY 2-like [Oryza brachyantha]
MATVTRYSCRNNPLIGRVQCQREDWQDKSRTDHSRAEWHRHCHLSPQLCTAFEVFYDGSWHGVNCIRIRSGNLFVKFIYSGSTVEHNVDGDCLRLRSRRATCSDCTNVLRPGVDVCVLSPHTLQESLQGKTKASVLLCHDARLITIKKNHQEDKCLCLFAVMLYKNQCPGNAEKVVTDRRAEVVTINNVFLLQKLQSEDFQDGSMKWSSSEDRLSLNRGKLLSARFSSEITHLIVLSILRGMEFNIKLVDCQIVYQIIKRDQSRYSLDSMAIPPGFGNTMEIISFQLRDEALWPTIRNIPITHVEKNNITEDKRFTVKSEMDSELDVEVLYEHVDLRRSKRLKTQPDRFMSYHAPRFLGGYKKKETSSSPIKHVRGALHCDLPVEVESCCVEIPVHITQKQTGVYSSMVNEKTSSPEGQHKNTMKGTACSLSVKEKPCSLDGQHKNITNGTICSLPVKEKTCSPEGQHKNSTDRTTCSLPVKEKPSCPEGQHKNTTDRTTCSLPVKEKPSSPEGKHKNTMKRSTCSLPVKAKPSSVEVEDKSAKEQSGVELHIPRTPAQNKEKHNYPAFSCKPKLFSSSGILGGNCEPAFCRKVGRKRKSHMCERECKQMIDQCIGNIQSEMERDSKLNLDVNMMNYILHSYREEDFTWPPSADNQEEVDELEELWKEMDYSLTTLALLEKKQLAESESGNENTDLFGKNGGIPCHHEYTLDEELGLACRICNVVCTEAKDIFPEMFNGNDYKDRSGSSNICLDDHVLDPSLLANFAPDLSESKSSESVWSAIADLDPKLLPHQRKALDFLWKNLAGSIQVEGMDSSKVSTGGCVIAHTPGSGKTLLIISFLVSYMKAHPRSRPLVLTPKAAINTWRREFQKWSISLPLHVFHHASRSGKPMSAVDSKLQSFLKNFHRPTWTNMRLMDSLDKLVKWHAHPSVLLMTYSSFLGMTKQDSKVRNRGREFVAEVLMNNPGILILDEGHNPRSTKSKLRKLLMKVKTEFRILLSGTAFQNNFEEYYNTLCLARPWFIGHIMSELVPERKKETLKRKTKLQEAVARRAFVEKVGQKIESSNKHDRIDGIFLLNKLTRGFIDSFEGAKLINLPGIHVYAVFMKPTDIQKEILAKVTMPKLGCSRFPLEVELLITIGSIHPWLIRTTKAVNTFFSPAEVEKVNRCKWDLAAGCKAKFVIDLLHKSSFRGERVLIFCHNVSPITFLVKLIEMVLGWRLGEEVLVLQGDQELPVRSDVMDKFNCDTAGKRKVLIASTTACAEGISLTGASRLVMLDSEWNHSKTRQAIARAFRPGQERTVYVYLLVASGTWEEDKYNSNRRKAWISKMVFLGRYVDDPLQNRVTAIDDDVLKELADEDDTGSFHMIVKQD